MQGAPGLTSLYSQHDFPQKLNTCAISTRKFPLPHEQDMWSQTPFEQGVRSQNLDQGLPGEDARLQHFSMLPSNRKLDGEPDNPAFNSSEDTDDYSDEVEVASGEGGADFFVDGERTTVMLCNIPCRVGRSNIVSALEASGLAGKYGRIHLPKGNRCRCHGSIGYGFISFS